MAQTSNRLFDELSRLVTDATGAAQGLRREFETFARIQIERLIRDMDLVTREEFEVQRDLAVAAREENERLSQRLLELETRLKVLERQGVAAEGGAQSRPPG